MHKFNAIIAASLTPFKEDGPINPQLIPAYAELLKQAGVAGVFVNGTTGEGFSLSFEERKILAAAWCTQKSPDFKVIIHVGATAQEESKQLAAHAQSCGADAIAEMGPLFYKPASVGELVNYCAQTAAEAPGIPYFFYHIPAKNGIGFPMIEFLTESVDRIPTLSGIKYSHSDLMDFELCREFNNEKYTMFHGCDETFLCAMVLGCCSAIGSTYNVLAPLYREIRQAFLANDLPTAASRQRLAINAIRIMNESGSFMGALRYMLTLNGLESGQSRGPIPSLKNGEILNKRLTASGITRYLNIKGNS